MNIKNGLLNRFNLSEEHFRTSSNHKTDLHFWVMPNAGFATRPALQAYIDQFEREHPDVRVKLTIHPWSLAWDRLMDVIKGRHFGPPPDVIQVGTTWVATLAYLGALDRIPMEGVLSEDDKMSAYVWDPGAQSENEEELFCVPWFIDCRVLYYRRDIFEDLGINPEVLRDWKGFYQACITIQKYLRRAGVVPRLIAPLAIPGQKMGVLMHDLAPWIWESGGDFCSEDTQRADLMNPNSIKGIEFYFDLIREGFMPIPDSTSPQGNFFTGHYAMQFSGSWPADTYLNPDSPLCRPEVAEGFDVALFPAGPQGRYTFLGGSNLGVTSFSSQKELAWELARFLSAPERQLSHAKTIGSLTARLASFEPLFERHPTIKKTFWDSLGHARRLPRLIPLGSVEQIISQMSQRLLSLIKSGRYNTRLLHDEIAIANKDIETVLSLHKYGHPAGTP